MARTNTPEPHNRTFIPASMPRASGRYVANLVMIAAAVLLSAGCASSKPSAWNLKIAKSTPATVRVDLFAVSKLDKATWESIKPDDYWAENSQIRASVTKLSTNFLRSSTWVVPKTDPIWKQWFSRGASELVIMADLPGGFDNSARDPRRRFLPLAPKSWDAKKSTLELQVLDERVDILTRPSE